MCVCACVCMYVCVYICVLTSSRVDFSISSKGSRASTCSTLACANKVTRGNIQLTNNKLCIQLHLHVCIVYKNYVLYVCMYVCIYINNLHKHHDKHTYLRGRLLSLWSGLSVLRFDNRRQRAHAVPRQNGRQYRLTIHSHGPIHTCPQVKIFTEYMMNTYIHT